MKIQWNKLWCPVPETEAQYSIPTVPGADVNILCTFIRRERDAENDGLPPRQIPKTKSSQQRRLTKVTYMARSSTTLKGSLLEKRVRGMEKNKIKENHPNSLPYSPEKRVAFRTQYSPCLFLSLTSLLVSQRLVTSTLSRPLHFGVLNNKAITPILRWPLDKKGPGVTWIQQN